MERKGKFGGTTDLSSRPFVKSVSHSPAPAFGSLLSREKGVATPFPALSELQSRISAGLEMPVLSSGILDASRIPMVLGTGFSSTGSPRL